MHDVPHHHRSRTVADGGNNVRCKQSCDERIVDLNRIVEIFMRISNWMCGAVAIGMLWTIGGCSDLKKDLPSPIAPGVVIHEKGWDDPVAANFHGTVVRANSYSLTDCAPCHAGSFSGGTSGVSCYQCHEGYPHMIGWTQPSSANSHGVYLKGKQFNVSECQACHGVQFDGGSSTKSCYPCHASYPHEVKFQSKGHTGFLQTSGYRVDQCKVCHGPSYVGGSVVTASCSQAGCHVDRSGNAKSPEACNTCHGVFTAPANDFLSNAPPRSVAGDTASTVRGVGAHQRHLLTEKIGKAVKCQECHKVPSQLFATGHVDTQAPAEVVFTDTLARLVTGSGILVPNPSYDNGSLKCANTYCHGNWKLRKAASQLSFYYSDSVMVGSNASPVWTGGSASAACGSCHGLPPSGHLAVPLTACGGCHRGVVNAQGAIIDPTKHVNGKINVFDAERPLQ